MSELEQLMSKATDRIVELEAEVVKLRLAWDCAYNQAMENGQEVSRLKGALEEIRTFPRKRFPQDIANEALK